MFYFNIGLGFIAIFNVARDFITELNCTVVTPPHFGGTQFGKYCVKNPVILDCISSKVMKAGSFKTPK